MLVRKSTFRTQTSKPVRPEETGAKVEAASHLRAENTHAHLLRVRFASVVADAGRDWRVFAGIIQKLEEEG